MNSVILESLDEKSEECESRGQIVKCENGVGYYWKDDKEVEDNKKQERLKIDSVKIVVM